MSGGGTFRAAPYPTPACLQAGPTAATSTMRLPDSPPDRLLRWHAWARSRPWLGRFTLANRLLLAMAFIPTGLVKATGQRFTLLPVENPVGFFFEAMYQTGPYWYFIGIMQVVAGFFLLVPGTATIGALLFVPIVVSIVLITWGIGFGNTVWITVGMLVSVTYLLCWDGDRIWKAAANVIGPSDGPSLLDGATPVELAGWCLGGMTGVGLLLVTRSFLPRSWTLPLLAVGTLGACLVVVGWVAAMFSGERSTASRVRISR